MHRVAVIGASGYTGVELLRLLSLHPDTELVCVTSRQYAGQLVSDVFPSLHGIVDLCFEDVDPVALAGRADLVFTAVPHQTAMGMIPALLAAGCRVIDLSADFRITDVEVYEEWYQEHTARELLDEAVYGLPELFREKISEARLIANPGCYQTSVALALAPLLEKGLIDHKTLIVDSKSGTSGAGRAPRSILSTVRSMRASKPIVCQGIAIRPRLNSPLHGWQGRASESALPRISCL